MGKNKPNKPAAAKPASSSSRTGLPTWTLAAAIVAVVAAAAASSWVITRLPAAGAPNATAASAPASDSAAQPQKKAPPKSEKKPKAPPRKPPAVAEAEEVVAANGVADSRPECANWAVAGECAKNPGYMADACAKSCAGKLPTAAATPTKAAHTTKTNVQSKQVDWALPTLPSELASAQSEADARPTPHTIGRYHHTCEDKRPDCVDLARWNLSACGEAEFMLRECPKTCRTCAHGELIGGLLECKDSHDACGTWAAAGECDANRRFMLSGCSKACGVCDEKKFGCARRNAVPGVASPHGMPQMFERALRDFPQFEPQALSTSPYVLQFDNIVSAEEARAIIDVAGDKLERSLAGDQISPVRTSTQFWCDDSDGCTSNPTVLEVTQRMMNVTQLPVDNAEYFQILRYEPGQFYKQHHDQQTAHWTPQGVRVYTFLVYLSDVEAGGGTKFNDLGLVVEPKLGRAVLWPSVIADDLLTGERKTHHEALAVEKGIKYAANVRRRAASNPEPSAHARAERPAWVPRVPRARQLWMHLYDFKTPSRAGICPFLGQNTHGGT